MQFRLIENRLGLRPPHRLSIKGSPYLRVLSDEHARWVEASQQQQPHRMIGERIGTGGTAGHAYLEAAAREHRVFSDLFNLPTFFVPRSALPSLPAETAEQMGFRYRGRR